jgi:ATP-dependent DNA ligase
MERINVAPGLSVPFYPPRPLHGKALTKATVFDFIKKMSKTHLVQPKLGGDRAIVVKLGDTLRAFNRHYGPYKQSVTLTRWANLPEGTVLDGEVYKKEFYPFEVVKYGPENLMAKGPEDRAAKAKTISAEVGQPYLFDTPTPESASEFIAMDGTNKWEGIVCTERGSRYTPLASAGQESRTWIKLKWPETK